MPDLTNISLDPALLTEAQVVAQEEGLSLEQVLNQALGQGLVGIRSEHFFRSRRGKGNVQRALEILRSAGGDNPPMPGDELPDDLKYLLDR
jgi:hypothetical protein